MALALHATTILGVTRRRWRWPAMARSPSATSCSSTARARSGRLHDGQVLAGFAGAVADALTLFEKFETQLKAWDGNLRRAAVELAKEWRTDRYLRRLEAQLIVADIDSILVLSGEGDVIEPDDGIAAIGSGAPYATAAAKALIAHTDLDAREIVEAAMRIAAESVHLHERSHFTIEIGRRDADSEAAVRRQSACETPLGIGRSRADAGYPP